MYGPTKSKSGDSWRDSKKFPALRKLSGIDCGGVEGHAKDPGNQVAPLSDPRTFQYDKSRIAGIKPRPAVSKLEEERE